MPSSLRLLVIDDNADSRFLLVKTLLRKFPTALVHESQESTEAVRRARSERFAAIITHRAADMHGIALVEALREANRDVPIIMVSSIDRREPSLAAGANAFLLYDEWLRVGTVVEQYLGKEDRKPAVGS